MSQNWTVCVVWCRVCCEKEVGCRIDSMRSYPCRGACTSAYDLRGGYTLVSRRAAFPQETSAEFTPPGRAPRAKGEREPQSAEELPGQQEHRPTLT